MQTKTPVLPTDTVAVAITDLTPFLTQIRKQAIAQDYPWVLANLMGCVNLIECESIVIPIDWLRDVIPFFCTLCVTLDQAACEFGFRHSLHAIARRLHDRLDTLLLAEEKKQVHLSELAHCLVDTLVDSQQGFVNLPHFYQQTDYTFASFFDPNPNRRFDLLKKRHGQRVTALSNQVERNRYVFLSEPIISYWKTFAAQDPKGFNAADKQPLIELGEGLWGAIISDPIKYKNCWQPLLLLQTLLCDTHSLTSEPLSAFAGALWLHQLARKVGKTADASQALLQLKTMLAFNTTLESTLAQCEAAALFRFDERQMTLHNSRKDFISVDFSQPSSDVSRIFNAQKEHTKQVIDLLRQCVQNAKAMLGPEVAEVAFGILGSTSRCDRRPYSDIEWMVVYRKQPHVSSDQAEFYVFQLIALVEMQIIGLGETHNKAEKNTGLHIDSSHHVFAKGLWGTPEAIAEGFVTKIIKAPERVKGIHQTDHAWILDESFYALLQPLWIVATPGGGSLCAQYDATIQAFLQAEVTSEDAPQLLQPALGFDPTGRLRCQVIAWVCLRDIVQKSVNAIRTLKAGEPVDIKQVYYKPLAYFAINLCLFVQCQTTSPRESMTEISKTYPWGGALILCLWQAFLAFVAQQQVNLHGAAHYQEEEMIYPDKPWNKLSPHEQIIWSGLDLIAQGFILPLEKALSTTQTFSLQDIGYAVLYNSLARREGWFVAWQKNGVLADALLAHPLLQGLKTTPSFDGWSPQYEFVMRDYFKQLKTFVTPKVSACRIEGLPLGNQPVGYSRVLMLQSGALKTEIPKNELVTSVKNNRLTVHWSNNGQIIHESLTEEDSKAIIPHLPAENKDSQDVALIKMITSKCSRTQPVYLPDAWMKHWFDAKGEFQGNTDYSGQRSRVRRVEWEGEVFYFKIKEGNKEGLMGREFAVQMVHLLLGGEVQIALGWPLKLTYARKGVQKTYYVWVSSGVFGESLDEVMRRSPDRLTTLDVESYSQHFLLAYLTCP